METEKTHTHTLRRIKEYCVSARHHNTVYYPGAMNFTMVAVLPTFIGRILPQRIPEKYNKDSDRDGSQIS